MSSAIGQPIAPPTTSLTRAFLRVATSLLARAAIGAAPAATCVVKHKDGTYTPYQASADTNLARGTALLAADAASVSAGTTATDLLILAPGTYDTGATRPQLHICSIFGAGLGRTILTTTYDDSSNPPFTFPANFIGQDFTLDCTGHTYYTAGWGPSESPVSNVRFFRCSFLGASNDMFVFGGTTPSATVRWYWNDCSFIGPWDSIATNRGANTHFFLTNCYMEATTAGLSTLNLFNAGSYFLDNCVIVNNAGTDYVGGDLPTILIEGSGVKLYLNGGRVTNNGTGAAIGSTEQPNAGTVYGSSGLVIDETKVYGNQIVWRGGSRRTIIIAVIEAATDTATGDGKAYVQVPPVLNGHTIVSVHARVITAGTTGTTDVQIARTRSGSTVDVLSTKLTIDSAETGSDTAATPAVINTSNDDLATYDLLRIDVDAVSTTPAKGLIITIETQAP